MTKDEAINHISALYPIDSEFEDTNRIGWDLLIESMGDANFNWRDLPHLVLACWAEKCIRKDKYDSNRIKDTLKNFKL